jgi:hypothetical protein
MKEDLGPSARLSPSDVIQVTAARAACNEQ